MKLIVRFGDHQGVINTYMHTGVLTPVSHRIVEIPLTAEQQQMLMPRELYKDALEEREIIGLAEGEMTLPTVINGNITIRAKLSSMAEGILQEHNEAQTEPQYRFHISSISGEVEMRLWQFIRIFGQYKGPIAEGNNYTLILGTPTE